MPTPSERDPLLADILLPNAAGVGAPVTVEPKKKLGPLEISNSNKYAILVGIWIANFLGVCASSLYNLNISKFICLLSAISSR